MKDILYALNLILIYVSISCIVHMSSGRNTLSALSV